MFGGMLVRVKEYQFHIVIVSFTIALYVCSMVIDSKHLYFWMEADSGHIYHNHKESAHTFIFLRILPVMYALLYLFKKKKMQSQKRLSFFIESFLSMGFAMLICYLITPLFANEGFTMFNSWRHNLAIDYLMYWSVYSVVLFLVVDLLFAIRNNFISK